MLLPLPLATTMQLAVMSTAPSVGLTELFGLATIATIQAAQPTLEALRLPIKARAPQPRVLITPYARELKSAEDEDWFCYPLEPDLPCETCELNDEWSDYYHQPIWMCSS